MLITHEKSPLRVARAGSSCCSCNTDIFRIRRQQHKFHSSRPRHICNPYKVKIDKKLDCPTLPSTMTFVSGGMFAEVKNGSGPNDIIASAPWRNQGKFTFLDSATFNDPKKNLLAKKGNFLQPGKEGEEDDFYDPSDEEEEAETTENQMNQKENDEEKNLDSDGNVKMKSEDQDDENNDLVGVAGEEITDEAVQAIEEMDEDLSSDDSDWLNNSSDDDEEQTNLLNSKKSLNNITCRENSAIFTVKGIRRGATLKSAKKALRAADELKVRSDGVNAKVKQQVAERKNILCKSIVLVLQPCITNRFVKVNPHYNYKSHAEEICICIYTSAILLQFIKKNKKQAEEMQALCDEFMAEELDDDELAFEMAIKDKKAADKGDEESGSEDDEEKENSDDAICIAKVTYLPTSINCMTNFGKKKSGINLSFCFNFRKKICHAYLQLVRE